MVRDACTDDIPLICDLLLAGYAEDLGNYSDCAQDAAYVRCSLTLMVNSETTKVFLDDAGRGLLVAEATQDWFAPRIHVAAKMLYVLPAHRGSTVAWRLLCRMEQWAKEIQAYSVTGGESTGSEIAVKLYDKLGYAQHARLLYKKIGEE